MRTYNLKVGDIAVRQSSNGTDTDVLMVVKIWRNGVIVTIPTSEYEGMENVPNNKTTLWNKDGGLRGSTGWRYPNIRALDDGETEQSVNQAIQARKDKHQEAQKAQEERITNERFDTEFQYRQELADGLREPLKGPFEVYVINFEKNGFKYQLFATVSEGSGRMVWDVPDGEEPYILPTKRVNFYCLSSSRWGNGVTTYIDADNVLDAVVEFIRLRNDRS